MLEQKILKVSQINSLARKILEGNFASVLIEGEISNLAEPNSGHIYFSLKDETAQVRAVMFRQSKTMLKFQPQNGAHVIVTAQVSLYEPRGDYQLIVQQMEPAGVGVLHAKFLQLKTKLAAEGLFDIKYKKPLPKLPQSIGVITSPTGAVIRDILNVLKRRFPSAAIIVYPVQVQGKEASTQIITALQKANLRTLEDLWPFNEEIVARAIFASTIPIVSAVGHETDFTISDFVADVRAPTPSVAAELVVPNVLEWLNVLGNLKRRLIGSMQNKLQRINLLVLNLKKQLRHPRYYLAERMQRLDEFQHRLHLAMQHQLSRWQQRLSKIGVALDMVSPLATLERGYAVISKDDKVIKRTADVVVGDKVRARLVDGEISCQVLTTCNGKSSKF